jgi:hypothetical protein
MANHKPADILNKEISETKKQIPIGSKWYHFKSPEHYYEITGIVVIEDTDGIGVLYTSTFKPTKGITFLRPIESFLSEKETENGKVKRFVKID